MSRNIRTLGDFRNEGYNQDSGEESDGQQEFYVGGGEHSGQQVLGPPGRREGDPRDELFAAARRAGAEEFRGDETPQPSSTRFGGAGARLGRNDNDPEVLVPPSAGPVNESNSVIVQLNIWENGFSLDDGPLRDLEAPENEQFLREIKTGRIPTELALRYPRQEIDLRMERKYSPYIQPKAKLFAGSGTRLGGVVPTIVSTEAAPAQLSQQESADALTKAQAEINLDVNSPTTQIQIRLNDGSRFVGKFNHSHTVSSVRTFIVSARPQMAFSEFQLMTTYPNKVIEDESTSLSDAGLLNAVIAVKPVI